MIKAIIGLGNPGPKFYPTRHNIGFQVVDALANQYGGSWNSKNFHAETTIRIGDTPLLLIKPLTFMNDSGKVMPYLQKKGIKPDQVIVVHDELEKPFGKVSYRMGGSARGHNGLRSIIGAVGKEFGRIRMGIGRPENRDDVGDFVLQSFCQKQEDVDAMIALALNLIEDQLQSAQSTHS